MEIPYTVTARPDTGLWNAKIGIWLFLASEVMLFGGLFSAYVFLRLDALPGHWPHGLLNVPVGTMNTADPDRVVGHGGAGVGGAEDAPVHPLQSLHGDHDPLRRDLPLREARFEWPDKFHHFGAFIRPDRLEKYEQYLGNHHLLEKGLEPRIEITGHLHNHEALHDPNINEYEMQLDPVNADPTNPASDRPHFWPLPQSDKIAHVAKEDVAARRACSSRNTARFSRPISPSPACTACTCSAGVLVFTYLWLPVGTQALQAQSRAPRQSS